MDSTSPLSPLPFTQEADFRQQREFGQKINATFEFIGAHWRGLGRVLLYVVVPVALLRGILTGLLTTNISNVLSGGAGKAPGGVAVGGLSSAYFHSLTSPLYFFTSLISLAFNTLLILSVYGYLLECLAPTAPGHPITVRAVGQIIRQKFLGTFFSSLGLSLCLIFACLFLLIPGIYVAIPMSLFFIVQMVENTDFGATLSRCFNLVKGKWWSTAGLIFIMVLIFYVVMIGLGITIALLKSSLYNVFAVSLASPIFPILFATVTGLLSALFYVPVLLALAFQYFNLVERKEAVGMYRLINQLGQAAPAGPTATTYRPSEEGEY